MFQRYNTTDNAVATLDAGISASTTTITFTLGQGALFPATNFIGTLVQYNTPGDATSGILKSEKVLVSSRSVDILTVTRGFDGDTATTFLAGDNFYLNVTSAIIEDIQTEVARLEDDKLNLGSLRTGLVNAWKMFFSNGSNNETELTFGSSGTVLTSNGTSSAPTWEVPSANITGLSPETALASGDELPFYDVSAGVNKKITKQNLDRNILVQNGVITTYTGTFASGAAGSQNSTPSGIITSSSIAYVTYSCGATGTVKLQTSPDGTTWTDLYTFNPGASGLFVMILKGGLSYRTTHVHTTTNTSTLSIQYSV